MSGELGRASLDLEANLSTYDRNMESAHGSANRVEDALDAVAKVARVAEIELNKVKMDAGQGARSREVADRIESSVGSVGRAAMEASRHLERVKLDAANAADTDAAGDAIDGKLKSINRIGVLGSAVGLGVLTTPAAAPAVAGLAAGALAMVPTAVGALATLKLAFAGVGKAIGAEAFKALEPAQQQFVQTVRSLIPWINRLKQTAGGNPFPGLTEGLHSALTPGTVGAITRAVAGFAQDGTAAYDKAVAAEAKALKAEIGYLDARGKNLKLSIGERMKAIRSGIADKKALAALLKQDKAANAGADQSQFLAAFAIIVQSYAPNAFPQGKPATPTKTDTHLHNLVNETREQTKRLDKIAGRSSFPFWGYMSDSAAAVFG